jgi:hypothetical protein
VWLQDDVLHERFYWLARPAGSAQTGQLLRAEVDGRTIRLESADVLAVKLLLSDALLDLDQPLVVEIDGRTVFSGRVARSAQVIWNALLERCDPQQTPTAGLELSW